MVAAVTISITVSVTLTVSPVYAAGDMVIRLVATDSDTAVAQLVVMLNTNRLVTNNFFPRAEP